MRAMRIEVNVSGRRGEHNTGKILELVSKILLRVQKTNPQGLKPAFFAGLGGTAEAVPYSKPIFETSSRNWIRA
jgi:hypothetical protein